MFFPVPLKDPLRNNERRGTTFPCLTRVKRGELLLLIPHPGIRFPAFHLAADGHGMVHYSLSREQWIALRAAGWTPVIVVDPRPIPPSEAVLVLIPTMGIKIVASGDLYVPRSDK
jgi:hypothetical protein